MAEHSISDWKAKQNLAVLNEWRCAKEKKDWALCERIEAANPDLFPVIEGEA